MLSLVRKLLYFRLGQKVAKGAARSLGFKGLVPIIGLVGGIRSMRRH